MSDGVVAVTTREEPKAEAGVRLSEKGRAFRRTTTRIVGVLLGYPPGCRHLEASRSTGRRLARSRPSCYCGYTGPGRMATSRHISPLLSHASSRLRPVRAENLASRPLTGRAIELHEVPSLPIGARLGDVEVAGVIHRGDAGFVYRGVDRMSLGQFAVKEYLPVGLADRMADGNIGVLSLRYKPPFREGLQ